jgi:hypothetical protein
MKNKLLLLGVAIVMATVVSVAGFPVPASAAELTTQQISAIMTLLQAFGADQSVVNNVQAALTGQPVTPPTAPQWCYTFNRDLQIGNNGNAIFQLQTALEKEGFNIADDDRPQKNGESENGFRFGESTAAAVVQFQAKYGIRQTGYVGPLTRAKLNSLYGCNVPVPITTDFVTYSGTTDMGSSFSMKYPASWTYYKFSCNADGVAFWPKNIAPDFSQGGACSLNGFLGSAPIILDTSSQLPHLALHNNSYTDVYNQITASLVTSPTPTTQPSITITNVPTSGGMVTAGQKNVPILKFTAQNNYGPNVLITGLSIGSENVNKELDLFSNFQVSNESGKGGVALSRTNSYFAGYPIFTLALPLEISTNSIQTFILYGDVKENLSSQLCTVGINGGTAVDTTNAVKIKVEGAAWGSMMICPVGQVVSDVGCKVSSVDYPNTTSRINVRLSPCPPIGDVNSDGVVSQVDHDVARSFVLTTVAPTSAQKRAADVNGDGVVSSADLELITRYIAGIINTFGACTQQPSTTQPSITVLTPTQYGSSYFKSGDTMSIQWSSPGVSGVNRITLVSATSGVSDVTVYDVGNGFPLTSNSYSWVVPTTVASGTYYVRVQIGSDVAPVIGTSAGTVRVSNPSPTLPSTITVTAPAAGTVLTQGQTYTIRWSASASISKVGINLQKSTGESAAVVSNAVIPAEQGSFDWTVQQAIPAGSYYLVIYNSCCDGYSAKSGVFTITAPTTSTTQPSITVLTPTQYGSSYFKSGDTMSIQWSSPGVSGVNRITLVSATSGVSDVTVYDVGNGFPLTSNSYSWVVPTTVASGTYYVRVQIGSDVAPVIGTSAGTVRVSNPSPTLPSTITVTAPAAGTVLTQGQTYTIRWSASASISKVGINLQKSTGESAAVVSNAVIPAEQGSFDWTVQQAIPEGSYYLVIYNYCCDGYSAKSGVFTITAPTTSTTQPTGSLSVTPSATSVASGGTVTLNYTTHSNAISAKLYLSCPAGVSMPYGSGGNENCNTWITWQPPFPTSSTFTVRNTASQSQNVVPNFYEYLPDNPNFAHGVSSQITVQPAPATTSTSTSPATSFWGSDMTANMLDALKLINPTLYR